MGRGIQLPTILRDGGESLLPLPALLLSTALLLSALPHRGAGTVYMTPEVATASAFPAADRLEEIRLELTQQERATLSREVGHPEPPGPVVFVRHRVGDRILGYSVIQDGMGKHEPMTFMVVLDPGGSVLKVAMLVYRESRGGEVAQERWLKQFVGKHAGDSLKVGRDVVNYAGATISSQAVARGVRRACLLFPKVEKVPGRASPPTGKGSTP